MNTNNYDSGAIGLVQYVSVDLDHTENVTSGETLLKKVLHVPAGRTVKILTENIQVTEIYAGGTTTLTMTTNEGTPTEIIGAVTEASTGANGASTIFDISGGTAGCDIVIKDVQASADKTAGAATASLMFVFVA